MCQHGSQNPKTEFVLRKFQTENNRHYYYYSYKNISPFLTGSNPPPNQFFLPAGDDKYGRRLRYPVQLRQWYRLPLEKGTANEKPWGRGCVSSVVLEDMRKMAENFTCFAKHCFLYLART